MAVVAKDDKIDLDEGIWAGFKLEKVPDKGDKFSKKELYRVKTAGVRVVTESSTNLPIGFMSSPEMVEYTNACTRRKYTSNSSVGVVHSSRNAID